MLASTETVTKQRATETGCLRMHMHMHITLYQMYMISKLWRERNRTSHVRGGNHSNTVFLCSARSTYVYLHICIVGIPNINTRLFTPQQICAPKFACTKLFVTTKLTKLLERWKPNDAKCAVPSSSDTASFLCVHDAGAFVSN